LLLHDSGSCAIGAAGPMFLGRFRVRKCFALAKPRFQKFLQRAAPA
jgi:hypothetical protein